MAHASLGTTETAPAANRPTAPDLVRVGLAAFIGLSLLVGAYLLPGAAALSLVLGAALGIVFLLGRFCFFCIFRDYIEQRDSSGMYAILAALAVGGIGYALVFGAFLPNPFSGRLAPDAHIGPVSWALLLAGLVFGLGMALSGGCISGHLYRLGEGYSRAPLALLGTLLGFGLGFATWNPLYLATIADAPVLWLPASLGYGGALLLHLALLGGLALLLLRRLPALPARPARPLTLAILREMLLHTRWNPLLTGALVGIIGTVAYLRVEPLGVTQQLGSLSRTALNSVNLLPERLPGLDTFAGCATQVVQTITENGWLIGGLSLGAVAAALLANRFQPSRLSVSGGLTALLGGVLMGWGAMIGLGCTVGTLLSGISAFAPSGWLFGLAVFGGVTLGLRLRLHRWG